ncbi:MAG: hypothetical protein JWM56_1167 [Candidatus Peribacteria bacterium]|nr:hypothetical protein [Candidatus Peribacteria bacterium]
MNPSLQSPLPEIAAYFARCQRVEKVKIPTVNDLTPELKDIMDRLTDLTSAWNPVELYTADPWSLEEEQEKFMLSLSQKEEYNPRFTYSYAEHFSLAGSRAILEELLECVRLFTPRNRTLQIAKLCLYFKMKDDLATCDLVEGLQERDEEKIGRALQYKYPGTDSVLLDIAENDYTRRARGETSQAESAQSILTEEEKTYLRSLQFNAEQCKKAFEWALDQYGILRHTGNERGFQVLIDNRATAMDVRDKSVLGPTVFIPTQTVENGERLLALIAHEIEGHARQSANGEQSFLFGGGPLKIDDETLYEGLAMRHEHEFRTSYFGSEESSPFPDFYAFGIHKAEMGASFHDVFQDQLIRQLHVFLKVPADAPLPSVKKLDPLLYAQVQRSSWHSTYRVMRGHIDTANHARFAMAKDLAYLRGWILDHQLSQGGHGHINEASISSIGTLRILAEFNVAEQDLPHQYKNVTADYLQMLLDKKPADPSLA